MTLLSRKTRLAAIRLNPIKAEVGGQPPAIALQSFEQFRGRGLTRDRQMPLTGDIDDDVVAFLEFESIDDGYGQAKGKGVSPTSNLRRRFSNFNTLY